MDTERFKKIEKIYHAAVELPVAERRAFVENACAGDEAVMSEVESLIALDEADGEGFLESTPQRLVAELIDEVDHQPIATGDTVGHFEIIELLGKGGMGEVYLARDKKLGRNVALKFLPPEFVANADRLRRFIREARTVSALNHPNIITIYDIDEVAGRHFIAAEYISGITLRQFASGKRVDAVQALEIAIQIASALDEAHSTQIAHRDIKPDNIMIRPNGLVKILDFGIAKFANESIPDPAVRSAFDDHLPPSFTRSGLIVGTADYMSPEQARGGEIDTRTDFFSFGIVLFEMLEGRLPFAGASSLETIDLILNAEPVQPTTESSEIRSILSRCLEKDRDRRYQTADELMADLRAARRSVDSRNARPTAEVVVAETSQPAGRLTAEPSGRRPELRELAKRNYARPAAFGALLAIFVGVFGYFSLNRGQQIKSIAVMPFVNASGNPDIEYLNDGMTESLIRRLSVIPELSVKARQSVFAYKDQPIDPKRIGNELNVDAVLVGQLSQTGDDLTLRLELITSADDQVVWSQTYQRRSIDISTFQGKIASDIAESLRLRLTSAQRERVAKVYTSSPEAHRLYLKGRFYWNKRNVKDLQRARTCFEEAIAIDSNFALAYAGLADTLALMPLYGDFAPKDFMPQAKDTAIKALELDPNLAEAYASLGYVYNAYYYDWDEAERHYRRAIDLNPGYATARQWYAENLAFRGRTDDALNEITVALELDPLSLVINRMKGNILVFSERYDDAMAQFERSIEMYPDNAMLRYNVGDLMAARGRPEDAVREYLIALMIDGYDEPKLRALEASYKQSGAKSFWKTYQDQLEAKRSALLASNPSAYFDDESLAFAYAENGDRVKTLEFLRRAYDARSSSLMTIGQTKAYDFVRNDAEFESLLTDVGLDSGR